MSNCAIYHTPWGDIRIEYSNSVVHAIMFCVTSNSSTHEGRATAFSDCVIEQITEYLDGRRTQFTFEWALCGTEFQMRVWRALCDIPYGERRTYKNIATAIGSPKASRAVGSACNRNPMLIVVPCHRVVGTGGRMVGYAGGVDLKERLLNMESATCLSAL